MIHECPGCAEIGLGFTCPIHPNTDPPSIGQNEVDPDDSDPIRDGDGSGRWVGSGDGEGVVCVLRASISTYSGGCGGEWWELPNRKALY